MARFQATWVSSKKYRPASASSSDQRPNLPGLFRLRLAQSHMNRESAQQAAGSTRRPIHRLNGHADRRAALRFVGV